MGSNATEYVNSYLRLVRHTSSVSDLYNFDPPAHTFEVRLRSPISIPDSAIAIVAPQVQIARPEFKSFLKMYDLEAIPYRSDRVLGSLHNWLEMMHSVEDYLDELEMI
jgi:hypothetical protein